MSPPIFRLPATQVAARASPPVQTADSVLPLVVIVLSCLLLVTSFLRRKLQAASGEGRTQSAFAYLSQLLDSSYVQEPSAIFKEPCPATTDAHPADWCETQGGHPSALWSESDGDDAFGQAAQDKECSSPTEPSDNQVKAQSSSSSWGCSQQRIYTQALMLVHRDLALRIAQGAPGLSPVTPPSSTAAPLKAMSVQVECPVDHAAKLHETLPQELKLMKPPTRWQKLRVPLAHGQPLLIHVNEAQHRYQVYCDQVELKTLSWGGKSRPKLQEAWRKLQQLVDKEMKV
eukprot:TRINITY_DN30645_c0_g1_i1.p1 TRINITY_DN30645_c0_g1~~TRINITY_DN30645_c0_g1_i1.p1  ORF type:complete len:287 (+),score=64.01 TRINITY_DN30645_c0_g1_i1:70-930(+)